MRDSGEYLFTSESVSEGHPDKVADRISDTVLDAYLAADPYARVACETLVTTNRIVLAGETRGPDTITPEYLAHLARLAVQDIGYDQYGFSWRNAQVDVLPARPIRRYRAWASMPAATRTRAPATRASCSAMPAARPTELMPAPIYYAHLILRRVSEMRRNGSSVAGLQPDAKSQVTLRYIDGKPVGATSIVVSTQHDEGVSQSKIKRCCCPSSRRACPTAGCLQRQKSTSTRPATSWSAVRMAIAA